MTENLVNLKKPFQYKLHVTEIDGQYDFYQGQELASQHLSRKLVDSFLSGRVNLEILFPVGLDQYGSDQPKLLAEFFVGLLEPLIEEFRNRYFKDTKSSINRSKIREVSKDIDIEEIFAQIMGPDDICDDLEIALSSRIKIGIMTEEHQYVYCEPRLLYDPEAESVDYSKHPFVRHLANKFYKSLDIMLMDNLVSRRRFTIDAKP